jgi:peptidoglycan/xylan/chitin deacetylase (PgdA/CDA1 family)
MVLLGLVLGVLVAVIVAAQGCGTDHGHKRTFHGSAPPPVAAAAAASVVHHSTTAAAVVRHSDPNGPFFGFERGHMTRRDAPRAQRLVALTFDDGPGPQTMQLLGELRRLHARATFFVVGSMAEIRPDVVRAEQRAGMLIGNHTWSHPPMPSLPVSMQRLQIERTNSLLRQLTGRRPRFFRPPMWMARATTARLVRREHMIGVLRTADTRDWTLPGVRAIVRSALRVRPGGIVALHDAGGYTRTETLQAVPSIVRGLRRRHLRLVTVAQLYDGR